VIEIYHRVHTSDIAQKNCCTFLHYNYDLKKYLTRDAESMSTAVTAQISTIILEAKKTTQPFLNRKIPLLNKNQTNGEKFKMTAS